MTGTSVAAAARWLRQGEVVAIPTETVYGLAACMFDPSALQKVFTIKNRPATNPLILHVPDLDSLEPLVTDLPPIARILAETCWPGPLTMVLPKSSIVPDLVTGGQDTVALRIPSHPLTLELLRELKFPLAAPSANKFNYISPVSASAVEEMLGNEIPYILDGGPCRKGIESTIVAFQNGNIQLLREGAFSREQLEEISGQPLVKSANTIRHPGKYKKHYSPMTPVMLTDNISKAIKMLDPVRPALISFCNPYDTVPATRKIVLSPSASLEEAASRLYASLYELDKENHTLILAEKFPDQGLGRAINDRLSRAAAAL